MPTLFLVRHAKSEHVSWDLADIDRPLNARGYSDAPVMAARYLEKFKSPDLIISSPAVRALSTALLFARSFEIDPGKIRIEKELYESSTTHYLKIIRKLSDQADTIMLFGHNPVISQTASKLVPTLNTDMPTCAIIGIELKPNGKNEVIYADYPKNNPS